MLVYSRLTASCRQLCAAWFTMNAGTDRMEREQDGWLKRFPFNGNQTVDSRVRCFTRQSSWTASLFFLCFVLFLARRPSPPPPPQWVKDSSFTRIPDHTQRRTTVGRSPLDEWSARRRDCPPDNAEHSQQIFMSPVGYELRISVGWESVINVTHYGGLSFWCPSGSTA
jgi:hypothetical protein